MSGSDVSPSSSVSQSAAESIQAVNVAKCMEAMVEMAKLGLLDKVQVSSMVKQSFGAYHAYLRTAQKLGSDVGSVSTASSGVSIGSYDSLGKVRGIPAVANRTHGFYKDVDWRKNSSSVLRSEHGFRTGYCYTQLLVDNECLSGELGPSPSFYDLMAKPAVMFKSDMELRDIFISAPKSGMCHVGDSGESALKVLRSLASASAMSYAGSDSLWNRLRGFELSKEDMALVRAYPMVSSVAGKLPVKKYRCWKDQTGHGEVRVVLNVSGSGDLEWEQFHELAATLPEMYDCMRIVGKDVAYISASSGKPSQFKFLQLSEAFHQQDYIENVLPSGLVELSAPQF